MATWSTNSSNVKVTSHATIEDQNPETYSKRGYDFELKKQYQQAEAEYKKAIQLSEDKELYTRILMLFYYRTGKKAYKAKADKLFKPWLKKYHFEIWLLDRIYKIFCLVGIPIFVIYFSFNEGGNFVGAVIALLFAVPGAILMASSENSKRKLFRAAKGIKGSIKGAFSDSFKTIIGIVLVVIGLIIGFSIAYALST